MPPVSFSLELDADRSNEDRNVVRDASVDIETAEETITIVSDPTLLSLSSLSEIRLSGCSLTEIPAINAETVTFLDLSHNKLTDLPPSFSGMNKVRHLNLSHNDFEELPKCLFQGMCLIKELNLSNNKLRHFNLAPLCVSILRVLKISGNFIECLPLWLFHDISSCLVDVDVSDNPCASANPKSSIVAKEAVKVCDSVTVMKLSNGGLNENNISFLRYFSRLSSLNLSNYENESRLQKIKSFRFQNIFNEIPMKSLQPLANLSELVVQNVGLPSLEDDVSHLANLKALDISHNTVNWLPKSLCDLKNLEKLVASNCGLYFLPCDIGKLKNLKELYIDENQVVSLPESCVELENLEVLDLYNNYFTVMPDVQMFRKLKAVDFSMNTFDLPHEITVNQRTRPYEEVRGNLHSYVCNFANRSNERKETASCEYSSESDSSEMSNFETHSCADSVSYCDKVGDQEEVWDCYSSDSDDYFDPNADDPHCRSTGENPFNLPPSTKDRKNYFCPCEETFQFWGTKKRFFDIAEGQFEDP